MRGGGVGCSAVHEHKLSLAISRCFVLRRCGELPGSRDAQSSLQARPQLGLQAVGDGDVLQQCQGPVPAGFGEALGGRAVLVPVGLQQLAPGLLQQLQARGPRESAAERGLEHEGVPAHAPPRGLLQQPGRPKPRRPCRGGASALLWQEAEEGGVVHPHVALKAPQPDLPQEPHNRKPLPWPGAGPDRQNESQGLAFIISALPHPYAAYAFLVAQCVKQAEGQCPSSSRDADPKRFAADVGISSSETGKVLNKHPQSPLPGRLQLKTITEGAHAGDGGQRILRRLL